MLGGRGFLRVSDGRWRIGILHGVNFGVSGGLACTGWVNETGYADADNVCPEHDGCADRLISRCPCARRSYRNV